MILDALAQGPAYAALNPRFARAFAFLRSVTPESAIGRHDIDGDEIYAFVQAHSTKPVADKLFEVHRHYIDIQYMVRGREIMAWAPLGSLGAPSQAFDAAIDAALYPFPAHAVHVPVVAGQFAIFFPADAHAPSCAWGDPADVLKVVVKVKA